ncbi:hypothetical protein BDY19DRAFT_984570 [Irpex rosettiformis]|uniref:Uncharacterized protein n=1 Tax=Irpex rosettiformis TaxID=378272 RepID=A0ACB8U7F7_9APHY|nr:hypothetical protein BDY19DRAFT_984570 [Irpex rosettiformis]
MAGFNWMYPHVQPRVPSPPIPSHPPQFRPLSWRTTLCRHFVKNQGWCPLGDDCGYIHDMLLATYATRDVRFPSDPTVGQGESYGTDRGKAASKHSHCWAYVQGLCRVKDCPYLHPEAIYLFIPHTPCLAWPNCTRGMLCGYKHPEPLIPKVSELRQARIPAPMHVQPQSPVQPSPVQVIPSGTVHFHGTTYFPYGSNQAPALAQVPSSAHQQAPQHIAQRGPPPAPIAHMTSSMHIPPPPPPPPPADVSSPHYTWSYPGNSPVSVTFQSPYYETVSGLPTAAVPRAFSAPIFNDVHNVTSKPMSALAPIPQPVVEEEPQIKEPGKGEEQPEGSEFPYRPMAGQRAGHARRVSVTLKSKEDSDALGHLPVISTRRESWMGHKQRDDPSHRSWPWAPDTTNSFGHSHSLQLVLREL